MKDFSEVYTEQILEGDKVKIKDVLGKNLIIKAFQERESKFYKNGRSKYIILQIELDGIDHVIFTSSTIIREQLESCQEFLPITGRIINNGRYYTLAGKEKQ